MFIIRNFTSILNICLFIPFIAFSFIFTNAFAQSRIIPTKTVLGQIEKVQLGQIVKGQLGQIEKVQPGNNKVILDAKIDTGAAQSSLSAKSITVFYKNRQKWLSFEIPLRSGNMKFYAPYMGNVKIRKRQNGSDNASHPQFECRPTILLTVCMANKKHVIKINLIDRSHFQYPMLIGVSEIKKLNAYVDVNQKYVTTPKCEW